MDALSAGDPQRIGSYWLAGRLGSGGQGVVYDAYDADGNRVAVKVLHAAGDRAVRGRFAKEATAARRVSSFCTARVLAADLDGHRPYLVSEYVPGPSLGAAVREGRRFTGDDLHRLATAVATALTAIHDAGVVHRDLKPDNVLLGPDGPRVIDFGIARTLDMSLTRTGEVSGTPAYMAPEVFTGERAGAPADVFAWGSIMVFAATGREPFAAENLGGVMHRVLSHRPDLSALPPRLAALVEAAMDKDPAARPAARDLLLALVSGNGSDTKGLLAAGSRSARGVHGPEQGDPALGTIAEDAYESLSPEEREVAAEVFLRLVTVDEYGHEAGRSAGYDELFEGRSDRESTAVRRVLDAFSYVISNGDGTVALSRPGLLRAWPRLRMWVEADRDGLALLNGINTAARHWAENGRRDADVLQGSRLEQALSWATTGRRHVTLTPFERDFLRAGTELTRRRSRRRTLTTVALAGLLVVSLVAGGLVVRQRQETARQRDILAAKQAATEADRQRTIDPSLAMLLSVAAWRVSPAQPEARSSLTASLQQQETAVFRDPPVKGAASRMLSRDGRTLVSASEGGVNVYDVRTGRRTARWPGMTVNGTMVGSPALSRSGRLLAETSTEELGVWDLTTGRKVLQRRIPPAFEGTYTAVFGEHETTLTLVYAGQEIYYLLDVSTGRRFGKGVFEERGEVEVSNPLVDPSGRHLLLPGERLDQRSLPDWRVERPFPACAAHPDMAAYSQDGRTLACGNGIDIALVDVASGRARGDTLNCGICGSEGRLRFSPDGGRLAAFRGRDVQVWDVRTRESTLNYRAEGDLTDVAFDPDGRTLRYVVDDAVVSLDLRPRTHVTAVPGSASRLSPDGRWAAVESDQGLRIWDVRAGREVGRLPVSREEWDPEEFHGTRLAVNDRSSIALWDARTLTKLWTARIGGQGGVLTDVHFTQDGRRLAMNVVFEQKPMAKEVVLDAADGHVLSSTSTRYQGGPLLPGDKAYASLLGGRFVDLATGKAVGLGFGPTNAIAFSRNGLMAVKEGATGRVGLWSVDGPTRLRPAMPRAAADLVLLTFSPDGRTLATVTEQGVLELWDVASRRRLGGSYQLGEDVVASLEFSADGGTLYAGADGAVHAIAVQDERVAREVCARAGRSLSPAEWERYLGGAPYQDVCP
ncbi:WD40 repeat domain-containing serine/threonine protein kinase [Nonomuraea sp. NPDC049695]|uniref:WD40 repeat domain-containing serine/threonine protein kinase n=1 Tax=Nonomuraea sp. NPDC049695 TaxID=3154734 RepID=UPI0034351568